MALKPDFYDCLFIWFPIRMPRGGCVLNLYTLGESMLAKSFRFPPRLRFLQAGGLFVLVIGIFLLIGCGGGGGGGGDAPFSPESTATIVNTDSLVAPGNVVQHTLVAGLNIFSLPTTVAKARYGLTIANVASGVSNVTVKVKPLSYVTAALSPGRKAVMPALFNDRVSLESAAGASVPAPRLPPNQSWIDREMRTRGRENASIRIRAEGIMRNILQATGQTPPTYSDHSGEALGDTVLLWVYARSTFSIGEEYTQRKAVLRRIGTHCKIFVDPDPFSGLSAVTGQYAISDPQLDSMVLDFDNIGWPLIADGYGSPWDIDQDGKITLFFSPLLAKNGFAGLFDTKHFEQVNADGTPNTKTNNRDMVAIWSPGLSADWVGDHWLAASRETCIHEFQHLVNYSIRAARNAWPPYLGDPQQEEVWLDEALSTGAEARFRILRNDPAGEDRFNSYSSESPETTGLMSFAWNLASYGHIGMFSFYLWEQGGDAAIRSIVQNELRGKENIDNVFAARGGLIGMYRDWGMAVLAEGLRKQGVLNPKDLPAKYRFDHDLALNLHIVALPFGAPGETTVAPFGTGFFLLAPPDGFNQSSYRFSIEGSEGVAVSVIRLP